MFDFDQLETVSIQSIAEVEDLSALMHLINADPEALRESKGPLGHRPAKLHLRHMAGYDVFGLSCSYGSQDGYVLAAVGDTVITYADGTFCILPTGTPAAQPFGARSAVTDA